MISNAHSSECLAKAFGRDSQRSHRSYIPIVLPPTHPGCGLNIGTPSQIHMLKPNPQGMVRGDEDFER